MRLKKFTVVFLFFFTLGSVFAQTRDSALFDHETYNNLPKKNPASTGVYERLPRSYSMKLFAPLPGDQEHFGTCVGWAAAYAARTIAESIALNRRNLTETTRNVFSPNYIYKSINPSDPQGLRGTHIYSALDWMRDSGAVRMLDIERSTLFPNIDLSLFKDSRRYQIAGYVTLFSLDDDEENKAALIIRMVKTSLSEGKPVIIGMNTPNSFIEARNVWKPEESPQFFYGGHAVCVIGYDDSRFGGSFEIINSWGRNWGNGGFMWIPYRVFTDFVLEAYEIIEAPAVFNSP